MKTLHLELLQDINFDTARTLAKAEASKFLVAPMTLSWFARRTGQHSPQVDCCSQGDKEAWEIYAESRGGTIRVEIGDDYVFIFREGSVERDAKH